METLLFRRKCRISSRYLPWRLVWGLGAVLFAAALVVNGAESENRTDTGNGADTGNGVRKIRLIQDDAQDYMVSKLYPLKYAQANDLIPFVSGMVLRYNNNSSVNSIEYGNNQQYLSVTCPVKMMPYVDDFVAKADRDIKVDGRVPGDIIRGTGITRAVYRPRYRSGQVLLNVLVNSVIGSGPWDSLYAWDANSNQIYWKDNSSYSSYVFQFLGYIDRPAPQIVLEFKVYEVRDSTMRDLGIEYLAWKNGPGMNIFQTAFNAFGISSAGSAAIQAMSGPVGGFLFAPQFDASFIRMLQQKGHAKISGRAMLTVSNSNTASYEIFFNPQQQNIVKGENDYMSVGGSSLFNSGLNQLYAKITAPVVNIHYGGSQPGYPASEAFEVQNYSPGDYRKYPGTLNFSYSLQSASVVERNNLGAELIESSEISGTVLIPLNQETFLGQWKKDTVVEQVIGVPFLSKIPILRYLFSTVTTQKETINVCVSVTATLLNTAAPEKIEPGKLTRIK